MHHFSDIYSRKKEVGQPIILVLLGADYQSKLLLRDLRSNFPDVLTCSVKRTFTQKCKLFLRLPTKFKLQFLSSYIVDLFRSIKYATLKSDFSISDNQALVALLNKQTVSKVIMFRVGLIILPKILEDNDFFFNVHCAKLPEFGGLAAINTALQVKCFEQEATYFRIDRYIDNGKGLAFEKFELSPNLPFFRNEDIAYSAGRKLLLNSLFQ